MKRNQPGARRGKRAERKVPLPEGWWGRLIDLSRSKWNHHDGDKSSYFDIYEFTKITRGTFSVARKTNHMTERTLTTLTENIGYDSRDDLLRDLAPPTPRGNAAAVASHETYPRPDGAEESPLLKRMARRARAAFRLRNSDLSLRLWSLAGEQAEKEANKTAKLHANLSIALVWALREPSEGVRLAEACLEELKAVTSPDDRVELLQQLGEVYRAGGRTDEARGFLASALEGARAIGSSFDEGFVLLSMSLLTASEGRPSSLGTAMELAKTAQDIFTRLRTAGDEKRTRVMDGQAQCHCCRADLLRDESPHEAIAQLTSAATIFEALGRRSLWPLADTLLRRAELQTRIRDHQAAFEDLRRAYPLFQRIKSLVGMASSHVAMGELLESAGRRDEAEGQFRAAAMVAEQLGDNQRAAPFFVRWAMKLLEVRKYDDAEQIFAALLNEEWCRKEHRLSLIENLCFVALGKQDTETLKSRSAEAVGLISELIREEPVPERRWRLLLSKGSHQEHAGLETEALRTFEEALHRFEDAGNNKKVAESLAKIRELAAKRGDRQLEREVSERILAIGESHAGKMTIAFTLISLAQLNIRDQRFVEAKQQLDLARTVDPHNPAATLFGNGVRQQLPILVTDESDAPDRTRRPTSNSLQALVNDLWRWCDTYPGKRDAILAAWYYLYRHVLSATCRSTLGVKFMVCTADALAFDRVRTRLASHADLFLWGINFAMRRGDEVEMVPVPWDLTVPAGSVKFVIPKQDEAGDEGKRRRSPFLEPSTHEKFRDDPYHAFLVADPEATEGAKPCLAGMQRRWLDSRVRDFMLRSRDPDLVRSRGFCFPLTEQEDVPRLSRVLQVARELGAIPVFDGDLPDAKDVTAVCDTTLNLPLGSEHVKEFLLELILSSPEAPKQALARFKKHVDHLGVADCSLKVYQLEVRSNEQSIVHPAFVITPV